MREPSLATGSAVVGVAGKVLESWVDRSETTDPSDMSNTM